MAADTAPAEEAKAQPAGPSPDLPNLPADFWGSRPLFRQMRSLAAYHRVSPDALLGNALARTAAMVHPETVMFSRPEPSGLDLLVSVLGPPGASKTAALKLGRRLMPIPGSADILHRPVHLLGMIDGLSISSGAGLIEFFMGEDANGERVQVFTNGLFMCDEGSVLKAIASRSGDILDEVLRCIFAGTSLSTPNATKERYRHVEGYAIGVVINMTPSAVGPLLAQSADGSPQRFLYFSAIDPGMPELAEACEPPSIGLPYEIREVRFDPSITAELDRQLWERQTGRRTIDPLDVHLGWVRAKVAAILTLWDRRGCVRRDDWMLAGAVVDVSCAVRREAAAQFESLLHEQWAEQGRAAGVRQSAAAEAKAETDEAYYAKNVWRGALQAARAVWNSEEMLTEGKLKNRLRSDLRHLWPECSRLAIERQWLVRCVDRRTVVFVKGSIAPPSGASEE